MNRILPLCLATILWALNISAQDNVTHKVRPGDTFASIASKYGVSEQELKDANKLLPRCYVGAVLEIPESHSCLPSGPSAEAVSVNGYVKPSPVTKSETGQGMETCYDVYAEMASALGMMEDGRFGKAQAKFTEIIKKDPRPSAYYYRGLCRYKEGKWKGAVNDFRVAVYDSSLEESLKDDAKDMLESAAALREEQVARRKETWATIGAAVGATLLVAGAVAADAYMYSETGTTPVLSGLTGIDAATPASMSPLPAPTAVPVSQMSPMEFNNYMNSEMQRLFVLSAVQVEQQNQEEYRQFCMFNRDADGNPLYTYDEWMAIRAESWARVQQSQNYSGDDVVDTGHSNGTNEYVQKVKDWNDERYGDKDCHICHGTGVCPTCNGDGWYDGGFGTGQIKCPNCHSQYVGKCSACAGKGTVYGIK